MHSDVTTVLLQSVVQRAAASSAERCAIKIASVRQDRDKVQRGSKRRSVIVPEGFAES